METTASNQAAAPEKEQNKNRKVFRKKNQLVYIEYEIPKLNGHKITVMDSYRNTLGRIHEHYDEQKDKFEYSFKDHEGKQLFAKDRLEDLKDSIVQGKEMLFDAAHQRRLERKKLQQEPTVAQQYRNKKAQREKGVPGKSTSKEIESFVQKVSDESRDVLHTVHEYVGGEGSRTSREEEIKKLRKERGKVKLYF